jgi:MSHA biogenesis protein MshJ
MAARLSELLNKLEALSPRERAMAIIGPPLVLAMAGELLVFSPSRKQAVEAQKQAELQQTELKGLSAALAALPVMAPLPGADQLIRQRNELQGQIEAARNVMATVGQPVNWGTVVRATVSGTPGLTLTALRTAPAELVFSSAMVKAPATAASAPAGRTAAPAPVPTPVPRAAAAAALAADGSAIYRHQAELTVTGTVGTLLGYVQTLQGMPGDLRLQRLQFSVAAYPQATIQLTLHTLSGRPETPFN